MSDQPSPSPRARRRRRPVAVLAAVVMLPSLVVGARQVTAQISDDPAPPPFSVAVDAGVTPPVAELPGFDVDTPRPVASILAEDGSPAEFVENELILATDDQAQLAAFLARWRGEVLATFDPAGGDLGDLGDLATLRLVRVAPPKADPASLVEHLRTLDADLGGAHRVSSDAALGLLTAAAGAAARGLPVGVNWVLRGQDFRDQVSNEAPTGPDGYRDRNAFTWPTHRTGGVQDIGVAEAWRALDYGGKLDHTMKVAILDGGFQPDADTPPEWTAVSNIPFRDAVGTRNLGFCADSCDWHGTQVLSAAAAVAGNDFGSAGPGGPVAEPILVNTISDHFTLIEALRKASSRGARIANISGGVPVPAALAWSAQPFDLATWAFRRSGMLIIAAAGNDGRSVDSAWCVAGICVEKTWHTPCENRGVVCVGGLDWDSQARHPDSNYGGEDVDIFAPYALWVGPDPDLAEDPNQTQLVGGTSYSAPFLAGVAALVWAADPQRSADQVADVLMQTAHPSPDQRVDRYVNALAAVQAVANLAPAVTIHTPRAGGQVPVGVPTTFLATADDYEDGEYCCALTWTDRRPVFGLILSPLGKGQRLTHTYTAPGPQTLYVKATDSGGASHITSVTFEVGNPAPTVEITRPGPGETVPRGQSHLLRAGAVDPNEPGGRLPCHRLSWTSSVPDDGFPLTGCSAEVVFPTTGTRTLTVTGTDSYGATGTARLRLTVVDPPPGGPPPTVRITSPADGETIYELSRALTLDSEATDPAGGGLDLTWSVSYPYDPVTGAGATTEVISPLPLWPSGARWLPADTFDTETWCELVGRPVRLSLQVVDAEGRTGSDHIVLNTYPCPVVD